MRAPDEVKWQLRDEISDTVRHLAALAYAADYLEEAHLSGILWSTVGILNTVGLAPERGPVPLLSMPCASST